MQKSLMDNQDLQQGFIIKLRKFGDDSTIINSLTQKKRNNIYPHIECFIILVSQSDNQCISLPVDWRPL